MVKYKYICGDCKAFEREIEREREKKSETKVKKKLLVANLITI
jgi:hypothetical protein